MKTMTMIRQEAWGSFGDEAQGETAEEVCKNAGLDFTANLEPLYDKRGTMLTHKHRGVFRDDTNECIGVVGKSYHVKQHVDVANLAHELTGTGLLEWNRVGHTNNGARAWFNLALPDEVVINGNEPIQTYMTLMNSHDGSSGIRVIPQTFRMTCGNQYNMMLRDAKAKNGLFVIRHTSRMDDAIAQMKQAIGMTNVMMDEWAKQAQGMMEVDMDIGERVQFYLDHLPIVQKPDMMKGGKDYDPNNPFGLATRGKNILDVVLGLEEQKQNQVGGMDGTLWQAVNVISDFIDHDWVTTKDGKVNEKRAESAIVGTGQRIKGKAWEDAMARVVA